MTEAPAVSVVIASFDAAKDLEAAIRSALAQTLRSIEVIVVDDCSCDDSISVAERIAETDRRVRVLRMPANGGPGGARSLGFAEALGAWVAVLDSDDLMHPERLERLLREAEATGADLIADNQLLFDDAGSGMPVGFLDARRTRAPSWIALTDYAEETVMYGRRPNLGFLKPVIRRALLPVPAYDPRLRIAEDDDLILRLLLAGARYRLLPEPLYFYRKHAASISHRLSTRNIDAMATVSAEHRAQIATKAPTASAAFARRDSALRTAQTYTHLLDALKAHDPGGAMRLALARPASLALLRQPVMARIARLTGRLRRAPTPTHSIGGNVLFVTRQRLVGATNGSSAYLLDLARAVREAGLVPHLLQPSPGTFGRVPLLRMLPEMAVFATHRIRGSLRIGDRFIARDPAIWTNAARAVVRRMARKAGLRGGWTIDRRAPHTITGSWSDTDWRYLVAHGRPLADVAIADYVFHVPALDYLLRPDARTAVVMHDLFHVRRSTFADAAGADSVAPMEEAEERALLGRADAVIAIQAGEADYVRRALPDVSVIMAPMAAEPVAAAQPGEASRLLFVGSNTAPNVDGLRWFFAEIWPIVHAARPDLVLEIAGTVAAAFPDGSPRGVRFLGLVGDLSSRYAAAGLVVSPLLQGSGLKIKLIEALAHGKAIIGTGVTLQGVEDLAPTAVIQADDPAAFAHSILVLSEDRLARAALAEAALEAARTRFGRAACHAAFRNWLTHGDHGSLTAF